MEIFRRLGLADKIRDTGLPPEFRIDVSCCVSATGQGAVAHQAAVARRPRPRREGRRRLRGRRAEWPHRINQLFLEPLLFAHAAAQPRIRILNRTEFEEFTQDERRRHGHRPRSRQRRADHDHQPLSRRLRRRPLGGAPRHRRGACRHRGRAARAVDLFPRAEADEHAARRAVLDVSGVQSAPLRHHDVDRRQGALADPQFPLQRRAGLRFGRSRLGDPQHPRRRAGFEYEIISKEDWIGRRLVADRFQNGRVFIAGDAAHLWIPHAGYGMNAGIADADESGLDARRGAARAGRSRRCSTPIRPSGSRSPIRCRTSPSTCRSRSRSSAARFPPTSSATTRSARRRAPQIGKEAYDLYVQQQCCGGLNFGYFYAGLADHRLRRRGASGLFDGQVRIVVGAGLPRAAFLAARRPLAL